MAAKGPDGAKPHFERRRRIDLQQRFLNAATRLGQLKDSHRAARRTARRDFP